MEITPFHLAIPVKELAPARTFYRDILQCREGRSDTHWVDFDLFGHQLVIHEAPGYNHQPHINPVDSKSVPVPHFGVVLPWKDFHILAERIAEKKVQFIIEPYIRFKGKPGEQATMFFLDPSGNALEFKSFKDPDHLFAR
jgi:extradiol dioxygenase family protein